MSDTISRQNLLRALTDISYNHCKASGEQEFVDTVKILVDTMANVHESKKDADCITRRDAMHVLDNCRFASEQEKKYAYSLMEQVASAQPEERTEKRTETHACDSISRQAAIKEFSCCELTPDGGIDVNDAIDFLNQLPSAQPFTDEEIQKMQDLEQAQIQKAYELGKADAQPELTGEDMKLIKKLRSYHNGSYAKMIDKLLAVASAQSEVIHCKDCKHFNDYFVECESSYGLKHIGTGKEYCYRAERRTND